MAPRGRPKGRPIAESHRQNIRNAYREPAARMVEQADPEELVRSFVAAIREGRIAPRYGPEIVRLMSPPVEDKEEA